MEYHGWPSDYGNPDWFVHDRFGLFIHWGLYSVAGRHEWVMNRERLNSADYARYFDHFRPDRFDPGKWADIASAAGMKYVVITTKHHEGFALWDSKLTDFKVTNTPAGQDLLRQAVDAFRARGLKIGFYHSLIDWHHGEFPIDGLHPLRDDEEFREKEKGRDIAKYAEFLRGQVRELLTQYGKIDYLWFDFSYASQDWGWAQGKGAADWQSETLERMILELQPEIILNDRLDLRRGVVTPEQYQPSAPVMRDGFPVIWEACQTLNGSWGYDRDNTGFKSADVLVRLLIDTVSKGGNLLLNVGPTGRGEFDGRSIEILEEIAGWMEHHSRAIYGATNSQWAPPVDCRYTQNGDRLYLHIFAWPYRHIHVHGLSGKIAFAQFVHDSSEVAFVEHSGRDALSSIDQVEAEGVVTLELPVQRPSVAVPVVELFLK